ncbi:MAG: universal stress protein [Rhodoferax sp.]|jgi:nucleotide-binding universal stress UspA family protein
MFKQIVIATDGSLASEHAAQLAVGLARTHNAKLMAVYVVDPYPFLGVGEINPMGFQSYMAAAQAQASVAHAYVEQICKQGVPVPLEVRLVEEVGAANGIVQTAEAIGADLIVLGSHGRSGISRLMLGSVSNKVVAESKVPVLVTR